LQNAWILAAHEAILVVLGLGQSKYSCVVLGYVVGFRLFFCRGVVRRIISEDVLHSRGGVSNYQRLILLLAEHAVQYLVSLPATHSQENCVIGEPHLGCGEALFLPMCEVGA